MKAITTIFFKNILFLLLILFVVQVHGQNSKWQFRVGYEFGYVSKNYDKTWVWQNEERKDAYFQMKATNANTAVIGLRYDVLKWMSLYIDYKLFFRKYYVWPGTYDGLETEANDKYSFINAPYVGFLNIDDKSTGARLSSQSWQFGVDFNHALSKSGNWRLHYLLSLNFDNFERGYFGSNYYTLNLTSSNYTPIPIDDIEFSYLDEAKVELNQINPNHNPIIPSTNVGLALSRKLDNGMGLRFELGLRNLRSMPDQDREYSWNLFLQHTEIEMNKEGTILSDHQLSTTHNFSLLHDGPYANLTFTFRPFRSKYDNPDYKKKQVNWNPLNWFGK